MSEELATYNRREIENRIFSFRGIQIMIDRDLAEMYGVETKVLNQAVKRNIERFPDAFRFQMSINEKNELVTNCDRFENLKHSSALPYVFTEMGVAMLSAVLHSDTAVKVSIQIMNAFVEMRKVIGSYTGLIQRMDNLEQWRLKSDEKFELVFKALEQGKQLPEQGIFFEGQIFDAYAFVSELIRSAKKSIQLIDNYIDESVLMLLSKRNAEVVTTIYTKNITKILEQDGAKFNAQYPPIELKKFNQSHDRFLIIDETRVYLFGASLKDLGKKWFGFSQINEDTVTILQKIKDL
jgi:hypothetical protein